MALKRTWRSQLDNKTSMKGSARRRKAAEGVAQRFRARQHKATRLESARILEALLRQTVCHIYTYIRQPEINYKKVRGEGTTFKF
jgi:hypothetical protein